MTRSLLLALLLSATGCASYLRGTQQTVHFDSIPSGAEIRNARTDEKLNAPGDVSLWRGRRHVFVASAPGYRPASIYIDSRPTPDWVEWWLWDLFLGFPIDYLAGGVYDLAPEKVLVVLEPAAPSAAPRGRTASSRPPRTGQRARAMPHSDPPAPRTPARMRARPGRSLPPARSIRAGKQGWWEVACAFC